MRALDEQRGQDRTLYPMKEEGFTQLIQIAQEERFDGITILNKSYMAIGCE